MDIISSEFLGNYHLYRFNTLTVRRIKRRKKNDMHHLNIGGFPIMLHRQGMYCRINPFQILIPWKKITDNSPGWLWKTIKGNKPHTLSCCMAQILLVRCILIPTQSQVLLPLERDLCSHGRQRSPVLQRWWDWNCLCTNGQREHCLHYSGDSPALFMKSWGWLGTGMAVGFVPLTAGPQGFPL